MKETGPSCQRFVRCAFAKHHTYPPAIKGTRQPPQLLTRRKRVFSFAALGDDLCAPHSMSGLIRVEPCRRTHHRCLYKAVSFHITRLPDKKQPPYHFFYDFFCRKGGNRAIIADYGGGIGPDSVKSTFQAANRF